MPCPELPMSIDNAVWHLSSDEAAGFVTSSSFNSSLSASRLAGDDASTADMISKFIAENITSGNEGQVQRKTNKEWQSTHHTELEMLKFSVARTAASFPGYTDAGSIPLWQFLFFLLNI